MKLAGTRKTPALGRLIALAIIALGVAALAYAWHRSANYPATDSAGIDADLVHIATPVGGRLVGLPVKENQRVAKGDVLLEIDPEPYRLTVQQAEADLAMARASLESRRRMLISERANSAIADEQLRRAEANHALAARAPSAAGAAGGTGLHPDAAIRPVPSHAARRRGIAEAGPATAGGRRQHHRRRGRGAGRRAGPRGRPGARPPLAGTNRGARPHDGYVTGLSVLTGETVAPSQSLFTLVASDEWFAVANFRETDLAQIAIGDCATVYSMIDRGQAMRGKVVASAPACSTATASTCRIRCRWCSAR